MEYKVIKTTSVLGSEVLNEYYKTGWELISAYCISKSEVDHNHYYYFKKVHKIELQKGTSGYCEYDNLGVSSD